MTRARSRRWLQLLSMSYRYFELPRIELYIQEEGYEPDQLQFIWKGVLHQDRSDVIDERDKDVDMKSSSRGRSTFTHWTWGLLPLLLEEKILILSYCCRIMGVKLLCKLVQKRLVQGTLPILKRLKENGCPWHNPTFLRSAKQGRADDIVQYVQESWTRWTASKSNERKTHVGS